jgi:hypothetical protein
MKSDTLCRATPLVFALTLLFALRASADSWAGPQQRDILSANGQFMARVTPADKKQPPQVVMHKPDGRQGWTPVWKTDLSNADAPVDAMVTDDGQHVVTLDNWHRMGFGAEVIAFYDRTGQRKRHSFEQMIAAAGVEKEAQRVSRSVSSRWWRNDAITLLDVHDGRTRLAIYPDWCRQWLTWDVATGEFLKPTAGDVKRLDDAARKRVLADLARGAEVESAAKFLGRLKRPEDRAALVQLLGHAGYTRSRSSSSGGDPDYYTAENRGRATADAALVEFDGRPALEQRSYAYLGRVHGAVRVKTLPKEPQPTVGVYLVPADAPADRWAAADPVHRLRMDLGEHVTSRFTRANIVDNTIPFRFECVTPGRYWVKAVYDSAEPYCKEGDGVCLPTAGDFESADRTVIEVTAGQTATAPPVDCTTGVGAKR